MQGWNKNVLDSSSNRFLYSSTLATYVHSLDNFRLEKLVSVHEVSLVGVRVALVPIRGLLRTAHHHWFDMVPEQPELVRHWLDRQVRRASSHFCC